jgi:type III restriction enzyme
LRFKFQLAKAVQQRISAYRQQAFAANFQTFLFGTDAHVTTSNSDGFAFDNRPYPAAWPYSGALQFRKHFFGCVGELKASGEEFECAKLLDAVPMDDRLTKGDICEFMLGKLDTAQMTGKDD